MSKKQTFVKLPNSENEIEVNCLTENIIIARNKDYNWQQKQWTPQPALIDKSGSGSQQYHGQKFDPKYFDLVQDGWTHDHCLICFQTISDNDDGYSYNGNWLCKNCYENFIKPKDYKTVLNNLKRIN